MGRDAKDDHDQARRENRKPKLAMSRTEPVRVRSIAGAVAHASVKAWRCRNANADLSRRRRSGSAKLCGGPRFCIGNAPWGGRLLAIRLQGDRNIKTPCRPFKLSSGSQGAVS